MNRPATGSESIAVLGATSALLHCRSIKRSVSMTGPSDRASVMPGLVRRFIAASFFKDNIRQAISAGKCCAYHSRQIRFAIGLGQQQHAGIEMAVMNNGFVGI